MSYHPLTSGSDYGVVVHNGTLTENGTRNVDLTTLSDDSTSSDVPSEVCCVHMLLETDDGGQYEVNDNTQTIDPFSAVRGGPNVWGQEADVDYFVAGITKSDGSLDMVVPNLASDPTVKITALGYSDVDWHDVEQIDSTLDCSCMNQDDENAYTDESMIDSEDASVGAGWHKGFVEFVGGTESGCPDGSYECDYEFERSGFAFADLAAYTPSHPEDVDADWYDNRGAGYMMTGASGDDVISFVTNADGEITFYWDGRLVADCTAIDW